MILLGHFDFSDIDQLIDLNARSQEERIDALRHAVANIIDDEVEEMGENDHRCRENSDCCWRRSQ
jgi:formiminoglutamase